MHLYSVSLKPLQKVLDFSEDFELRKHDIHDM